MKVLCAGFVQLVLEPGVKPETFRMDWGRLADTKMTVELLASKAAMLTVLSADSTRLLNARAQPAQGEVQALLVSVGEVIDNSTSIEVFILKKDLNQFINFIQFIFLKFCLKFRAS